MVHDISHYLSNAIHAHASINFLSCTGWNSNPRRSLDCYSLHLDFLDYQASQPIGDTTSRVFFKLWLSRCLFINLLNFHAHECTLTRAISLCTTTYHVTKAKESTMMRARMMRIRSIGTTIAAEFTPCFPAVTRIQQLYYTSYGWGVG